MGVRFSQLPNQWKVRQVNRDAEGMANLGGGHISKDFG
jgi:hypothetical protein